MRYPLGDDTFPRKEDTALWNDYIAPSWQPVEGAHVTIDDFTVERENEEWPQRRALAAWDHPDPNGQNMLWVSDGVPLRVSIAGLPPQKQLLALFELKRFGRLYLIARPITVNSTLNTETTFDSSNCFLSSLVPNRLERQLDVIRSFRDEILMASATGRDLIDLYYALSPRLIDIAEHYPLISSSTARFVEFIAPLVDEFVQARKPTTVAAVERNNIADRTH